MENKQINVVWCDDNIEELNDEMTQDLFKNYNCVVYKTAKTTSQLKLILEEHKKTIDAVIVDFNMSDTELTPSNETASGFRWVHEHLSDYAPIPFYLYSGREPDFIKSKYDSFEFKIEGDYFLGPNSNVESKRNRYFQSNELSELLEMISNEVPTICTPAYKIRQEYLEAFRAIDQLGLNPEVFLQILLSNEDIDRYDITKLANPLRMVIENLISKMESAKIIPFDYLQKLNSIPLLLAGKDKDNKNFYSPTDYMPNSLYEAFVFFLKYTQDGSHDKNYLSLEFCDYLKKTKDIYIVKALAVIGLDIIKWSLPFYEKYAPLNLCPFSPFETNVNKLVNVNGKDGAIAYDSNNKKYFIPQPSDPRYTYSVGTRVNIEFVESTTPAYGDFYVKKARNLNSK